MQCFDSPMFHLFHRCNRPRGSFVNNVAENYGTRGLGIAVKDTTRVREHKQITGYSMNYVHIDSLNIMLLWSSRA